MDNKSNRLEWLDAMRGFTMILVVAYHVAQYAFGENLKTSTSLPFFVLFRMPLFFFVSGFLAYKSNWIWTPQSFLSITWKKIKIQVFPAIVFLCIFIILRGKGDFLDRLQVNLYSPTKGGYWFTWVLLQMFVVYYVVAAIADKMKSHLPVWILWIVCVSGYISLYLPNTLGHWYRTDFMRYASLYETINFMQFFVLGNLVHRYWKGAERLMDNRWTFTILTIIAFFTCADIFRWHTLKFEWTNLPHTLAMYSLLLMVVIFFRHYKEWFGKDTLAGKSLQYIGVRTLDIYLIHFILLPKLPMIGKWLDAYRPNFVVELVLTIGVALIIISACLLVSNILRVSPLFKEYLFGRK